jgi:hypothetical protein
MQVATGTVVNGKIIVEGAPLIEGAGHDTSEIEIALRRKEVKRTLSALSRPEVAALIDKNKLTRSSIFAEISGMALDLSITTGDNGPINLALELVRDTKFEELLAAWFCQNAGLEVAERGGKKKLIKSADAIKINVSFAKYFPSSAEARDVYLRASGLKRKSSNPNLRIEIRAHKSDVDMLDSKARLPGSFGAGKRR